MSLILKGIDMPKDGEMHRINMGTLASLDLCR